MPLVFFFAAFFFLSGFSSLVYEVVWLRLGMAAFGVNAPVVSLVLSIFMAGLGLGSWLAGRLRSFSERKSPAFLAALYGCCELCVCLSAPAVPRLISAAQKFVLGLQPQWASAAHYAAAGLSLTLVIMPWTVLMGATIPLVMPLVKKLSPVDSERSFSFLYLANLLGAACGTLCSAFVLIELLGLRGTLYSAAALNLLAALGALALAPFLKERRAAAPDRAAAPAPEFLPRAEALALLFFLGVAGMGMEVVWIRLFVSYLGTTVYSFAAVLAVYLLAGFLGAWVYRARARAGSSVPAAWLLLMSAGFLSALPVLFANPYLPGNNYLAMLARPLLGVAPFAFASGYLTPLLVDGVSGGNPRAAGSAYAVNVAGCILGPLLAGFALLPLAGERGAIAVLAAPLLLLGWRALRGTGGLPVLSGPCTRRRFYWAALCLAALLLGGGMTSQELDFRGLVIKRDSEATTLAFTSLSGEKALVVNGSGMTSLTPATKFMTHMPLAMSGSARKKALVIAFGMGTSFRSALSWGIDVTAVDLVPSVPELFWYFHDDAEKLLELPNAHVVVDDGRRYLARTGEKFGVIIVDPPPPVCSPASGLLYSREFYELASTRLEKGGILQQWAPGNSDAPTISAVAGSLLEVFPHTRAFVSREWPGVHFLAANEPIPALGTEALQKRLPAAAAADLLEWSPGKTLRQQVALFLSGEIAPARLRAAAPGALISDDRPFNEYFLLRKYFPGLFAPVPGV